MKRKRKQIFAQQLIINKSKRREARVLGKPSHGRLMLNDSQRLASCADFPSIRLITLTHMREISARVLFFSKENWDCQTHSETGFSSRFLFAWQWCSSFLCVVAPFCENFQDTFWNFSTMLENYPGIFTNFFFIILVATISQPLGILAHRLRTPDREDEEKKT